MAVIINDINFEEIVLKSELPVMLDVYTEWCGPCRAIAPYIEQMATDYDGRAIIGKADAEKCPEISEKFGIRTVPTFLFFKNGKKVDDEKGANKQSLINKLNALL
jgi:thioredoxin 1